MQPTAVRKRLAFGARLSKISPWQAGIALFAVLVFSYWAYLGGRFVLISRDINALETRRQTLTLSIPGTSASGAAQQGEIGATEQRFQDLKSLLAEDTSDYLVGVFYAAADRSTVRISSVSIGKPESKVADGVQSHTVAVSLTLAAGPSEVSAFIKNLTEELAAFTVSDLKMAGLDGSTSAQMQLLLYYSPETAPKSQTPAKK